LSGFSATVIADGDEVTPEGLYEIAGTKTYPTALGGTNTVPLVRRLPFEPKDVAPGPMNSRKSSRNEERGADASR
jgi:hypothetical protein